LAPIRAKCQRLLGSSTEAEDVAQETFVRLWQLGPPLPPEGDARIVMAWLYRTCTRLSIDTLRKRRRAAAEGDEMDRYEAPCGVALDQALAAKRVMFGLGTRLQRAELEAAVLCRVDGLSHGEAAVVLLISERTLRRLLDRFDQHSHKWKQELMS
jgi:RNA polymerase sigma-70 factor (ECF subfamily)